MRRATACVLLLAAVMVLISPVFAQDRELTRVKNDLKACRTSLNDLEDESDKCFQHNIDIEAKLKDLQLRVDDSQSHDAKIQLATEETELAKQELVISQERLAMCETSVKSKDSREHNLRRDLDLVRAELTASTAREAELEKMLRQNDCAAARRDLRTYRDMAEQCSVEKETLQRSCAAEEGELKGLLDGERQERAAEREELKATCVEDMAEMEAEFAEDKRELEQRIKDAEAIKDELLGVVDRLRETETALFESQSANKAMAAELDATKRALESLLKSLDVRKKYDDLLETHQKEWLPHWLQERLQAALAIGRSAAAAAANAAMPVVRSARSSLSKLWLLRLKPALSEVDAVLGRLPGWSDVKISTAHAAHTAIAAATRAAHAGSQRVIQAEKAAEAFILAHMQRVEALQPIARHDVVHYALWGAVVSAALPLAFLVLRMLASKLIHALRPGSAAIAAPPPPGSTELARVEEALHFTFSQQAHLAAAFSPDSRGYLAWLGGIVARALAAADAVEVTKPPRLLQAEWALGGPQQQVSTGTSPAAMAAAAARAGLAGFVAPGPGAKSAVVAEAQRGELFASCLGAAWMDAEFDLSAARRVWGEKKATQRQQVLVEESKGAGKEGGVGKEENEEIRAEEEQTQSEEEEAVKVEKPSGTDDSKDAEEVEEEG